MDFDTLKLSELEKVFGNELKDYYADALREEAKEPLGYALDHFIDEVVSPDVNHKTVPTLHISKVELLEMNSHNESQINSHNTYWEELAQISNLIIEKNEFLGTNYSSYKEIR